MPVRFPEFSQRTRAYFYRVVAAGLPLLVLLGVVDIDEVGAWLGFAAAVLAVANTPTKENI